MTALADSQRERKSRRILRVLLIRHGETDHNVAGIIQGQLDTPLNALGRIQASLVGRALATEQIDEIYSSPLERASDTAKAIYDAQPSNRKPPMYHDSRLKERAFGSLEGVSYRGEKTDAVEGIEKSADLALRLASFWNDLIQCVQEGRRVDHGGEGFNPESKLVRDGNTCGDKNSSPPPYDRTVALVAHGAALSSLLNVLSSYAAMAEGVNPSRLWNCSITEVIVGLDDGDGEWQDVDEADAKTTTTTATSAGSRASLKHWKIKPPHLIGDLSRRSSHTSTRLQRLVDIVAGKASQNASSNGTSQSGDSYPILITRWAGEC